ncbi:MAG TPA: winged helix-turn-helix domain-containing protein [Blastocatellia bacterium]|nr:winged helix-turn-helix domain-containing protein [Blastocatellia bacterium]
MKTKRLYEFGPFRLDPEESLLLRDGKPVYLKPKVLETLLVLVESSGRVLDKETLMQRLWQDTFVEEANLTVNISQLRKALGQTEGGEQFIETMPRRGYRFAAEVREVWVEEGALVVKEYTSSHITIEEKETEDRRDAVSASEAGHAPAKVRSPVRLARDKKLLLTVAASLVAFAGLVALAFNLMRVSPTNGARGSRANSTQGFGDIKLSRLTNIGNVHAVSISPDGRYVAYVVKDGRKQALWAHHVATSQSVEVVPAAERHYWAINFTPDSNYVDYSLIDEDGLYRVAVLGGPSKKIIEGNLSNGAYSPDGKQFAFVRRDLEKKEDYLILANADGTDQKVIAARGPVGGFSEFPGSLAWSPDGKTIAAIMVHGGRGESYFSLVEINLEDGAQRPLSAKQWLWLMGVTWAKDGRIFITASDEGYGACQVWRVSYPDGELERVTNDLSSYLSLSLAEGSNSLVTLQQTHTSTIWVAPNGDASQATQISSGTTDGKGICATPDGRLVYTSKASGNHDLWIMNGDGTGKRQLTRDAGINQIPAVTPDGRYIVFASNRSGRWGIWRIDIDGSNPGQLTSTSEWVFASCSPDSKWIVYQDKGQNDEIAIWKVSIDGGEPVQLTRKILPYSITPVSPDGEWIACTYTNERGDAPTRLGIIPFEGGEPVKSFDLPPDITFDCLLRWAADGSAIHYTRYIASPKIWTQPIDGSPAKELSDFKTDGIWDFTWTPDGKQLFCGRGGRFGDVVLISDLK